MDTSPATMDATAAADRAIGGRYDRLFYASMAIAAILAVFVGFARTYFLSPLTGQPIPTPLVQLHALIFTAWTFLILAQTTLISKGRTDIHRRLGVAGVVLAVLMVVLTYRLAIVSAQHGFVGKFPNEVPPSLDGLKFLVIGVTDLFLFSGFVWAAILLRSHSDWHKRLMILATINLLPAALLRIPLGPARMPVAFALLFAFVAAGPLYDWTARGRVHPAFLWGGLVTVLSQPLRVLIGATDAWHAFASWLTR